MGIVSEKGNSSPSQGHKLWEIKTPLPAQGSFLLLINVKAPIEYNE
jgi:hypothetical protein